jgi:hypothetical protein
MHIKNIYVVNVINFLQENGILQNIQKNVKVLLIDIPVNIARNNLLTEIQGINIY